MGKINVAIIGVGNCASSLVQGVHFYRDAKDGEEIPGIMHPVLGDYCIADLNFVAAFDIDKNKVGKDLSEAIFTTPNNTFRFTDVPSLGVPVQRGMTHDGLGKYLSEIITKAPGSTDDIVGILKEREVDVVINYLPVGSEEATKWYVEQILEAGCGMVNCIPVFIAREEYWSDRFRKAGVTIVGDDFLYRELKEIADDVRDEILLLPDVSKVDIYGAQEERIFVEFNNARLAEVGLSTAQLQRILESRNIIMPGGDVTTEHEKVLIEPSGNFQSVDELRQSVINIPGSKDVIALEDLVDIRRGYVDRRIRRCGAKVNPAWVWRSRCGKAATSSS